MSAVVIQILILGLLLLVLPAVIGGLCARAYDGGGRLIFRWVSGQFLLWAGFQLMCVPMILRQQSLSRLALCFGAYGAILVFFAVALEIRHRKRGQVPAFFEPMKERTKKKVPESAVLWAVFAGGLLFQLVQAVRLAFDDADDAYFVAVASLAESSDQMYQLSPYGQGEMELDFRHALAPFSIWIAFLARVSGMRTVVVAQVALPVVLIAMAYGIYYLFSCSLFPEQGGQRALFMIFTELLVLFGNYSVYTSETFLIGRTRQGKATLGSIVVPFLLLLLLVLLRYLQKGEKVPISLYLLLGAAGMAGCLCSTLGALLSCMVIGLCGLCGAVCYKRLRLLFSLTACCVPCVGYALLYVFVK